MDISERGETYGLGQGEDYYGIWDLRAEGAPMNRYPKTPEGWQGAWERWRELEKGFGRPLWRRPTVGMVALHTAIGLVIGVAIVSSGVAILAIAGRTLEPVQESVDVAMGAALLAAWIFSLAGWLLFVYLTVGQAARWVVLSGLVAASLVMVLATGLSVLPVSQTAWQWVE